MLHSMKKKDLLIFPRVRKIITIMTEMSKETTLAIIAIVAALGLLGVVVIDSLLFTQSVHDVAAVGRCPTPSRPSFGFNHT